jgi:MraZ protein
VAAFFSGEYRHQADEKMRIRIPSKLKELLGEEPFITCGAENNLIVIRRKDADEMMERSFGSMSFTDIDQHEAVRMMFSRGFSAEEDKQGRIQLPAHLVKHAGIKKNVVTIGAYRYIEIWSEENWDAYSQRAGENLKQSLRDAHRQGQSDK